MSTIVFSSYKGGVGRTQCLANVAAQLVKHGANVGMLDLDFEAPGLHQVFDIPLTSQLSMVDVLVDQRPADFRRAEVPINFRLLSGAKNAGELILLPGLCGSAERFAAVTWTREQLNTLRDVVATWRAERALDYVLIDARAGMSMAFAAALTICDKAVMVFRLNRQNQYGIQWMLDVARDLRKPSTLVASLVPVNGTPELSQRVRNILSDCAKAWNVNVQEITTVPYVPELALDERVLVTSNGPEKPAVKAFQSISSKLQASR